jgi:sulfide dehydrogenase [flavocytochrome c] flavoprotein chain
MRHGLGRRAVLAGGLVPPVIARGQAAARVVIVGGGFGGAAAARTLRRIAPSVAVTLLEPNEFFHAGPLSNLVVIGARDLAAQRFGYDGLRAAGVHVVQARATAIDATARVVTASDGSRHGYDRLILSPGIDIAWSALPGYDEAAAAIMPHAWIPGLQTALLRDQLAALPEGGTVVMSVPPGPYRCPPGPYERASLIAWFLKSRKPRAKLIVLDAKDEFPQKADFIAAWKADYGDVLRWVPLAEGGKVTRVDAAAGTFETEAETWHTDLGTVVPPQRAGAIATAAGVVDRTGWCPINPTSFESTLVPGIHVIGDAALAGVVAKSASAAVTQAAACAAAVHALLDQGTPAAASTSSVCHSLLAPDRAVSVFHRYLPEPPVFREVETKRDLAPPEDVARSGRAWFADVTRDVFG